MPVSFLGGRRAGEGTGCMEAARRVAASAHPKCGISRNTIFRTVSSSWKPSQKVSGSGGGPAAASIFCFGAIVQGA